MSPREMLPISFDRVIMVPDEKSSLFAVITSRFKKVSLREKDACLFRGEEIVPLASKRQHTHM
jgi:hypothetical protein